MSYSASIENKVLLVANPAAQNGKGAAAAQRAAAVLRAAWGEGVLDVVNTQRSGHAVDVAREAASYATVIALGGDGVINEAANGLMSIAPEHRPVLGIVPVGSGNDYARTLGMSCDVGQALDQILSASPRPVDVGCVNGRWFVETLSFGLDAAIALDTVDRRAKTGRTGTILYMESGIDQLVHHLDSHGYVMKRDEEPSVEDASITFAVQIGPTYGGGFRICPEALVDDGLLDVCIAHPPIGMLRAIYLFLRAKSGKHVGFDNIEFARARSLRVVFEQAPPAQVDGERIVAKEFDISIAPRALRVLFPVKMHS